jgi:peptidoglycan-associated lipoprotein
LKRSYRLLSFFVIPIAMTVIAGCHKKQLPSPQQTVAPPAAVAPTAQISATPNVVSAGDQVVITWRTTDATQVSIDGIGDVPTSGVKTLTPAVSTSYHLVARGEGGSADATARVTVNAPPAVVEAPTNQLSAEDAFRANVQDIFFDYDAYDIRSDAQSKLSRDAAYLNSNPGIKILIGGYCDERGSNEYNLALGENRANAARNALVTAGVAATRIRVVSYGKEKPFCSESTEECWQQNRRAGFTMDR